MREQKSAMLWSQGLFTALLAVAVLAPPAWAYVNGGDFRTTVWNYQRDLWAQGWRVAVRDPMPRDCHETGMVEKDVKVTPSDNAEFRQFVNQLVGRALQFIPDGEAEKISIDDKREVARQAREALENAVLRKGKAIKEGRVGPLQYQVGAYTFESYWETKYGGKREVHARRSGLVPFVALKVVREP